MFHSSIFSYLPFRSYNHHSRTAAAKIAQRNRYIIFSISDSLKFCMPVQIIYDRNKNISNSMIFLVRLFSDFFHSSAIFFITFFTSNHHPVAFQIIEITLFPWSLITAFTFFALHLVSPSLTEFLAISYLWNLVHRCLLYFSLNTLQFFRKQRIVAISLYKDRKSVV